MVSSAAIDSFQVSKGLVSMSSVCLHGILKNKCLSQWNNPLEVPQ